MSDIVLLMPGTVAGVEPGPEREAMTTTIPLPRRVGSRTRAGELLAELPTDLSGSEVSVEWRQTDAASPSFVDELIRLCLDERHADVLRFVAPLGRTAVYARRAARQRGLEARLVIEDERQPAA